MSDCNEFDNIIRLNFRAGEVIAEVSAEENVRCWVGFAEEWLRCCAVPEESTMDSCDPELDYFSEVINAHLRENLPLLISWAIETGLSNQMADYWEIDEFIPALAELLLVRVMGSHWGGVYCDGEVGQPSIACMDWGRIARAFVDALDSMKAAA